MEQSVVTLTVCFEEPFWIGIYEREAGGRYVAAKTTFGAEPKDYEIYAWILRDGYRLRFSPAMKTQRQAEKRINPKRMQRRIHRQLESETGAGTKAQQALKLQQEQGKLERKTVSRARREAEKNRQFELHQEKRKQKHRGH